MLSDFFTHIELLSKLELVLSNSASTLPTKFMSCSLNSSLSFRQCSQHLHRMHPISRKPLVFISGRSSNLSIASSVRLQQSSHTVSGSTSSSLAVSNTSTVSFFTKVLSPSTSSLGVGIHFSQTPT
jgi:hypothetical protein